MVNRRPRVLVFDSGVGALSIGSEIHQLLPAPDMLYIMDCNGFPYGGWDEAALTAHICQQLQTLCERLLPDLVVVACNSASTAVLPALRERLAVPVVGVVPAIKPAAATSRSGVIGLLATPGTVRRDYTERLINDFASHCTVIRVGSAALAPAVERLFWEGEENPAVWQQVMAEFQQHPKAERMDTVVLACTHFPLVQPELARVAPGLDWVDSGEAIARRVRQLLHEANWDLPASAGHQRALILGLREATPALCKRLDGLGIQQYQRYDRAEAVSATATN